jgi:hypothetical protein
MPENLTPKQRKAIVSLMQHGDVTQAAADAGVSRDTVYRWQRRTDFAQALQQAQSAALQEFSVELAGMGHLAAQALREGLQHGDCHVRLRAASLYLQHAVRVLELLNIERRISELEVNVHVRTA